MNYLPFVLWLFLIPLSVPAYFAARAPHDLLAWAYLALTGAVATLPLVIVFAR